MTEEKWKAFYFNGQFYCGMVIDKNQWKEIIKVYEKYNSGIDRLIKLRMTKISIDHIFPRFVDFVNNGITLEEWAKQNDVNLF